MGLGSSRRAFDRFFFFSYLHLKVILSYDLTSPLLFGLSHSVAEWEW